ncbi:hypothetical protein EK403_08720 [Hansschlegelia zhihuaiae]|uniref:Uncharacterized protein n=1 Tax=Hansschlegelia zhihuaiae TaxID=405005 RepID=A0A4Q0MKP2_9HYPH|nr:hypothetical protein EK403_08720 [Hansschlegelia zhihuaiae]
MRLTGLSAFPITPSDAAGRVDVVGLRKLVGALREAKVDPVAPILHAARLEEQRIAAARPRSLQRLPPRTDRHQSSPRRQ